MERLGEAGTVEGLTVLSSVRLSGKAATRIANALGEQDNIAFKLDLSRLAMLAYTGKTKNLSAVPARRWPLVYYRLFGRICPPRGKINLLTP
jgi:hypothetical protein